MKIVEFLSYLNSLEIKLWLEAEKLKYQAPPGVMTAEIKQEIGNRKTEIIAFLKIAKISAHASELAITPVGRDGDLPLSFAQQRMWFLHQMDSQNPSYNESPTIRLTGNLNIAVLEQSLNAIIERHEILRTTFPMIDGKPVQKILPSLQINLIVVNLQDLPSNQIEEIIAQELQKPFDLTQAPLVRFTLLDLSQESYILVPVIHHIIIDGWSKGIFFKELSYFYQSFLSKTPVNLPQLPIQYADFAVWQRQWLQGEILENQLNYWQKQLADAPPLLELPTDQPRPSIPTFQGHTLSFQIDPDLTDKLKTLSQRSGVTLFMTLLAAFTTLLFRYSHQEDILIGTPVANRNRQEIEPLMGFFVNTLVMRNSLQGNPTFGELLQQVRQGVLGAYANQDVPFEQVVDVLQIERSLSYNPLFQVIFALQNAPLGDLNLPGLKATSLAVENVRVKFDLSLVLEETETETGNYLEGFWEYSSDLFTPERITRLVGHFQTLLKGIVTNPQQRVEELPLLTEAEKYQLLVDWNQTESPYPRDQCIHQLFEEQVTKNPDAIAIIYEQESLTYQQLNQKANQLAHYLKSLGVETDSLVGICVERSLEMIVGLLGILKAGGAYVPLDPDYPQERLSFMLTDTQVKVLLTKESFIASFPTHQARIVCLDKDWETINQESQDNLNGAVSAENLAYIIYTSGSTGIPKGVVVNHQAVNRLVLNTNYIQLTSDDRIVQASNIAFDAATFEIWGALLNGAKIVILTKSLLLSPQEFALSLKENQISVLFLTTALFNQLASLVPQAFSELRYLLFGGEAVDPKWVQEVLDKGAPEKLLHVYGPTENTTFSSWYLVEDLPAKAITIPIGQPISNTQIYLLDKNLQPVPIGVPGELYLGGAGLARGYLNRLELTQERFIPHPFENQNSKLYKTGDLVRYQNQGQIEFIGRIDDQVKIRGFRIELGEIEAVITDHPQVRKGIVMVREDEGGTKRLSAYIIPETSELTSGELRLFLQDKLPHYMVPAFLIFLEAFPLTTNGKIDRRALPKPEILLDNIPNLVMPSTEIEKTLADIWQTVLGLKQVSINDNFFELGGDSILAIQIIAKANQVGLKITPNQLFSHQTISQLATVTERAPLTETIQGLVIGNVPLTPIQQWFFEQNLPEPHHFNQAMLLEVGTNLKPDLLKTAIAQLLYHHDALRLRFIKQDGKWQQYNSDDWHSFTFEVIDLSCLSDQEQLTTLTTIIDKQQRSFNLEKGPLVAVVYCQLANSLKLSIVIHHLAVDGVSWRILLEDLATVYQQLEKGETPQLPPKTSSFKDWAEELQIYAQSPELKAPLNYWLTQDFSALSSLPRDYQADVTANTVASAKTLSFCLTENQTRALLQDVPQAYNTQINDVLLTALIQAFAKWTNFPALLLDIEGHGRENLINSLNLSRTVGWFTSIFPVYLTLETINHPGESLKSVKEQLRQIPRRGVDYGIGYYLNSDLTIQSHLRNAPKPEVSFNYLGQFTGDQIAEVGWQFSKESSGSIHGSLGRRSHLIEINSLIVSGKLEMEWQYSENFHQKTTIENLAHTYQKSLEALINHCLSAEGGYTPSDFPDADLNQTELDELLLELE
ncbi:non ribosomal peptide synthetase, involved in aeruginosin biosynthesis [Planktothrix sp. PCC 11201]|uniref:non-ribosomal peptide synthetase n=1 Tax=Planktothrix sp. PCC 11201 TaxID=1729650 RepID=UPI00092237F1|nr:non-ribosomal peptide synthetase [Planktothrix sp. PCC 11201]SKB14961.1 non ribosomal peptide synthetase, involved in aeruginosin biosynthesis [Planktothrix sp. PCC 11201]